MTDVSALRDELSAQGVQYVFGAYVDVHGVPKSKCVPIGHLQSMAGGSELYTVGALEGMGELGPNEDECVSIPDLDRITVLPWDRRFAVAPANLFFHGDPYSHDSRHILKEQVRAAAAMGFRFNMGVEPELYVLRDDGDGYRPFVAEDSVNAPTRGYDLETTILADPFLDPMVRYINELGWDVYSFDHEGGDGQYEFDFGYTDGLSMADRMVIFRLMAKHVARSLGCIATFMPKPSQTAFGSGAHLNVSLASLDTGENLFDDQPGTPDSQKSRVSDPGYSKLAHHFTAGVLRHGPALMAVLAPTVNSYKRLLPRGLMDEISWAPVYQAYGYNNRTLMCRLPVNRRCLEVRTADSAANVYLGSALVLAAGLEGIREELDPGEPVNFDTYKAAQDELEAAQARRLPLTLGESVAAFRADDLAQRVFGDQFHADYAADKQAEWDEYNTVVGEWERNLYLQRW